MGAQGASSGRPTSQVGEPDQWEIREYRGNRRQSPRRAGTAAESSPGFVGCDETIERLYFYLDGELTEQRRIEITRHLDLCGPCVGAYGFEAELRRVIANRCKDHVPDALIERVAEALHNETQQPEQLTVPPGLDPSPGCVRSLHWSS